MSDLGAAIADSANLSGAANLYDRGQARAQKMLETGLAAQEKEKEKQDAADATKAAAAAKWIEVNSSNLTPNYQIKAQQDAADYWMKAANKGSGYFKSVQGNMDTDNLIQKLKGYQSSSAAVAKDIILKESKPDNFRWKTGYEDAFKDPNTMNDFLSKQSPDGTYQVGQGLLPSANLKEINKEVMPTVKQGTFIEPVTDVNGKNTKGWISKGAEYNIQDTKDKYTGYWLNHPEIHDEYTTPDSFIAKAGIPTTGRYLVPGSHEVVQGNWAPPQAGLGGANLKGTIIAGDITRPDGMREISAVPATGGEPKATYTINNAAGESMKFEEPVLVQDPQTKQLSVKGNVQIQTPVTKDVYTPNPNGSRTADNGEKYDMVPTPTGKYTWEDGGAQTIVLGNGAESNNFITQYEKNNRGYIQITPLGGSKFDVNINKNAIQGKQYLPRTEKAIVPAKVKTTPSNPPKFKNTHGV
jgi:hypothetical protein